MFAIICTVLLGTNGPVAVTKPGAGQRIRQLASWNVIDWKLPNLVVLVPAVPKVNAADTAVPSGAERPYIELKLTE